jgi:hypothetical protein
MDTLLGITARDWWRLLRDNRFSIDRVYWKRAVVLSVRSLVNSYYYRKEKESCNSRLTGVQITEAPIFILGHWRSGTTLLHNLFALDRRFAYPTLFQVSNPHTFLTLEPLIARRLRDKSAEKRPMDNVKVTFDSPAEDEFGICILSLRSPILSWSFPRRESYYDRYLTFEGVDGEEIEAWSSAFQFFMKKLTLHHGRPLVLKSPAHTARIRLILDLFPDARIIHIHRDPYRVFQSTKRLYEKAVPRSYLQNPDLQKVNGSILRRYKRMYDVFFEQRDQIPKKNFWEISFEELEAAPVAQLRRIYEHFSIPGFDELRPELDRYLESIAGYKKNQYPELEEPLRGEIAEVWQRSFKEWGYST